MRVAVRFFAMFRERAGVSHTWRWSCRTALRPRSCSQHLLSQYPSLPSESPVLMAVNSEYVSEEAVLQDGDEVAFIPPVSGG